MPNFKIINDIGEIKLDHRWAPSAKFNSKDRRVNECGREVYVGYEGRQYRIIEKRERVLSTGERIGRGFLGVLLVIISLSGALLIKEYRGLFTKSKKNIRYAVLEKAAPKKQSEAPDNQSEAPTKPPEARATKQSELLFSSSNQHLELNKRELNFSLVGETGSQRLAIVTTDRFGKESIPYEGSSLEALFKIGQDKNRSTSIRSILDHPNNFLVSKAEFLKFILEKDDTGTPRICALNAENTFEILKLIKERKIQINLNEKTPEGKTLFTLWIGRGAVKITRMLLELDPSVIKQMQNSEKSTLVEAVLYVETSLKVSREEADLLLKAMEDQGIPLSQEEIWIKRAIRNDCAFLENEFKELNPELKMKIFFAANAFDNEAMVRKLRVLLGINEDSESISQAVFFTRHIDIVEVRNRIENFLKDLRSDGSLLTEEEFKQLDTSQYFQEQGGIWSLGRIQGKKFIERLVKAEGFTHIKVPQAIVVVKSDSMKFHVSEALDLRPFPNEEVEIYHKKMNDSDRLLSLEEAVELLVILERSEYRGFSRDSFYFAEDGIYFIDTGFKNFFPDARSRRFHDSSNHPKSRIDFIKSLLKDPRDVEKLVAAYEKRKEGFEMEKRLKEEKTAEIRNNPYKDLSRVYCYRKKFTFQMSALTP